MPCLHKFNDYLKLETITFKPTTLIVGTFNPAWPDSNPAQWFYGRTNNNNFWDVLPRLYEEGSLLNANPTDWKSFCNQKKIAITDLISCIEDADEAEEDDIALLAGYSDKAITNSFHDFDFVDIVSILKRHDSIENVYLTRGIGETFWRKLWKPVKKYCEKYDKRCKVLLTPSGYAYYQQGKYNNQNPGNPLNLPDFILMKWREKWHNIQKLNDG